MSERKALPEGPLLAIDPGTKRVGIACMRALDIVHPVGYLDAEPKADLLEKIKQMAQDRDCVGIVVGLPVNMDGSEGPAAKWARAFGGEVEAYCALPVAFCDERLTSEGAQRALGPLELTRKQRKKRIDAVAAAAILETYLQQRDLDRKQADGDG